MRLQLFLLFSTSVLLLGCGSSSETRVNPSDELSTFVVGLERAGGFTGIEERFEVTSDGITRKSERFPNEFPRIRKESAIDSGHIMRLRNFLSRNRSTLDTLNLSEKGNMTSAIDIKGEVYVRRFTWANFDPPKLHTSVLDSLYQIMFDFQSATE